ncbi:MAG TPA: SDR family NAD(P)-dependent oxidoreductase, partial [Blastococcus sp.]|nr:SDR family NAD(P)-dependent oxidoreductase [Blastococcus sp.]
MPRVFITGSADGLGRATARTLLDDGHEVVVHARSGERLAAVDELLDRGAVPVAGDLADLEQTRHVAEQVNGLGRMDAVIHNAGVYTGRTTLPVNVVAPYLLTALIERPQRLVFLTSGMHRGGQADLAGMDWTGRSVTGSYSDSKLFVATLSATVRLRARLTLARIPHRSVAFPRDRRGAGAVRGHTGGYETSPTVRIGETYLANPSLHEVRQALAAIAPQ